MDINGKIALVTGASSGIGQALAKELLSRGAYCVLASRRMDRLNQIAGNWTNSHPAWRDHICAVALDVRDESSCKNAAQTVIKKWGKLHILVNNAGYGVMGPLPATPVGEAQKLFDTNFFGACRMTNAALPFLREARQSYVVMVSSIAALNGVPWMGYYCASKAAMNSYAETLQVEERRFGLRVLVVMPGPTESAFSSNSQYFGIPQVPRVRIKVTSEDVAVLVCRALRSNRASIITGAQAKFLVYGRRALKPCVDRFLSALAGPW